MNQSHDRQPATPSPSPARIFLCLDCGSLNQNQAGRAAATSRTAPPQACSPGCLSSPLSVHGLCDFKQPFHPDGIGSHCRRCGSFVPVPPHSAGTALKTVWVFFFFYFLIIEMILLLCVGCFSARWKLNEQGY